MRTWLVVMVAGLAIATVGCGGDQGSQAQDTLTPRGSISDRNFAPAEHSEVATPTATPQGAVLASNDSWPLVSEPLGPCNDNTDDEAECAEGFSIGEVVFHTSSGQIKQEYVTSEQLADGLYPVNVVRNIDPTVMVAYKTSAQRCNEGPEEDRWAWHFAFASNQQLPSDAELCEMQDFDRPGQPVPDVCRD